MDFYEDDDLLVKEYKLLELTLLRRGQIREVQARRHISEGFDRRLLMMQSSRIFMRQATVRQEPFDVYLWEELNVHLNAYYINLRGALDNLAWALKYELGILPDVTEDSYSRPQCNLFGRTFLVELKVEHGGLVAAIEGFSLWEKEIRDMRDPAAHRIPLTAIAGVITSEGQLSEFRRLEALAARQNEDLDGLPRSHYLRQAQLLAEYKPLLALSSPRGLEVREIPSQIAADHLNFLTLASSVLEEILEVGANPVGRADV